ncbi:MAG: RNA polymerase-associated protein RapA, partial [Rhodanobacteraceae bacterium]
VPRYRRFLLQLVPPMLASAEETAQAEAERIAQHALQQAERQLGAERQRLLALREVNPAVSHADVERVENELQALRKALPSARLRLDSLRMVVSPQFLDLR